MGASHFVANAAKRQFFRVGVFGDEKGSALLRGLAGRALGLLLAGYLKLPDQMGCWTGDPLFIVTDGNEPIWSSRLLPDGSASSMGDYDVIVSSYTDVTYPVLAGLGRRENLTQELIEQCDRDEWFFLTVATILMQYDVPPLKARFVMTFGKDWRHHFDLVWRRVSHWEPLPSPWGNPTEEPNTDQVAPTDRPRP